MITPIRLCIGIACCATICTRHFQMGHRKIDLLKLDIEGAEYSLLEALTANGRIRAARQLLVEFHHGVTQHGPNDTRRIVDGLADAGFRLVHTEGRNYIFRQDPAQ